MNNRVGLGVFGTFGEPNGYQQLFYHGVVFSGSLDLDETKIEFYPGERLYAVKRELRDGVYTVCLCAYSFVRELNTERFGTFLGNCIVLQDGYAEADYVFRAVNALHDNVVCNTQNVENSILVPQQVQEVVLREGEEFLALRANVIPVSKTPFFSSAVTEGKEFFVTPNPLSEDDRSTQVTQLFEKALKDFTDTETIYFSFDRNVYEFVAKEAKIEVKDWDDYIEYKPAEAGVVRTKKGIHRATGIHDTPTYHTHPKPAEPEETPAFPTPEPGHEAYMPPLPKTPEERFANSAEEEDDPYRPFDRWDEPIPDSGWPREEVRYRVKEYNRLFTYTNTLLEHMNDATGRKKKSGNAKTSTSDTSMPVNDYGIEYEGERRKRRPIGAIILLGTVIVIGVVAFLIARSRKAEKELVKQQEITPAAIQQANVETPDSMINLADSLVADTVFADTVDAEAAPTKQPIAKAPIGAPPSPPQPTVAVATPAPRSAQSALTLSAPAPAEEEAPRHPLMPRETPIYMKAQVLHPRPNTELTGKDVPMLHQMGIKNKTIAELTRLLFDNSPANIGIIYKGHEDDYGTALLNANKQHFKRYGDNYVCTIEDDGLLRIPAYKSPRLPAVYPK
jgi:hypothetical protein